jgi:bacteriocin-like protein
MEYDVQNLKAPAIRELNDSELNSISGGEGPLLPVIRAVLVKAHLEQLQKEQITLQQVGGPSPY